MLKHFLTLSFALMMLTFLSGRAQTDTPLVFTVEEINDAVFARMKGYSYPEECTVPLSALRYLRVLHYDLKGDVCVGEMVCNKAIADDLLTLFRSLYDARYPIGQMRLIDDFDADDARSMAANNTSCFCYRRVAGSTRLSKHSLGMAVDINPLYNPWVRTVNGRTVVTPAEAAPYADRSATFPCKLTRDDLCTQLFLKYGFRWGGNWKQSKDYQHFEK
jgi:hypothetical protein